MDIIEADTLQNKVIKTKRRYTMKKILALITCLVLAFCMVACSMSDLLDVAESAMEKKDFTVGKLTITLHEGFAPLENKEGYDEILGYNKVIVMFLKEDIGSIQGYENTTLDEYAALVLKANKDFEPGELKKEDGLTYFEYKFFNEEENATYKYMTVMFEQGEGIFWTVQFATFEKDYSSKKADMTEWAKSVKFN